MNSFLIFLFVLISVNINAQTSKLKFEYDSAGNQIVRELCLNCNARQSKSDEPSTLAQSEYEKFIPDDIFSYYPNPVKEELFLKWEIIENISVKEIQLFNINGQILKSYSINSTETNISIPFQEFPRGVYFVHLNFTNNEQKSIKIIKQ